MIHLRGKDWGGGVLKDRNWVDGFTHAERFDGTVDAGLSGGGLVIPLFQVENDAYITVITKFAVDWASPLIGQVWKVGLRFGQGEQPDQARDYDGEHGDYTDTNQQPSNGFVGPRFQDLVGYESVYVVRPGRTVAIRFEPVQPVSAVDLLRIFAMMPPQGTVYVMGGRLQ